MYAKLVHVTQAAEETLVYIARVSSTNQSAEDPERLIKYLLKHKHWSPFEMVSMCVEVETSRAIAAQLLRHRSFSFQEFSQRYAEVPPGIETSVARAQATQNRQSSTDTLSQDVKDLWTSAEISVAQFTSKAYYLALESGVSREQARMLLPLATKTRLYVHGTARSWIHYLQARLSEDAQQEHRELAEEIYDVFAEHFPIISTVMGFK